MRVHGCAQPSSADEVLSCAYDFGLGGFGDDFSGDDVRALAAAGILSTPLYNLLKSSALLRFQPRRLFNTMALGLQEECLHCCDLSRDATRSRLLSRSVDGQGTMGPTAVGIGGASFRVGTTYLKNVIPNGVAGLKESTRICDLAFFGPLHAAFSSLAPQCEPKDYNVAIPPSLVPSITGTNIGGKPAGSGSCVLCGISGHYAATCPNVKPW